ncbi:hypothetical protein B5C34_14905 [Pacificimonas flava]|uniref:DUF72 domain-containing protein n=2 Tax=Pacificimonas TaxID=1960290 RepID=A0A219B0E2_9SPHN|nr:MULTISPECIES: DUF72 domain-containing protein [Pacificimonas]MBZ6379747.1 DUF72 domain-containing protein [Pacificimonas aurantium]OWV31797.1 hypothetical protein B5C34_14905 [Pacificimonas flava]
MSVHIGIGGWTFAPWRGTFYPGDLRQKDELNYAAKQLSGIEVNGTFYRRQKPETFEKWRGAAPAEGFRYALKASRYATNRKNLAEAGEAAENFCRQGIAELGPTLGPINWQLAPTKHFDRDEIAAFLDLLPDEVDGLKLRHAVEARHESFACAEFVDLMRGRGAAIVIADHPDYPQIADLTADFAYVRVMRAEEGLDAGYTEGALDEWVRRVDSWAGGHAPDGLDYVKPREPAADGRDVFLFFIGAAKLRNPAAAQALISRC